MSTSLEIAAVSNDLSIGRADATLNPSGVRFGSSDLYGAIEQLECVEDCLAVGQKFRNDERVVLFIKTPDNRPITSRDISQIKDAIREKLSQRHIPAVILAAPELPYTLSNKRCEIAVKRLVNGRPLSQVNAEGIIIILLKYTLLYNEY